MNTKPWSLMTLSGLVTFGCTDPYLPHRVDDRVVITGSDYVKSGQRYPRSVWRTSLGTITADNPQAHAWARAAQTKQYLALAADALSLVTGIAGLVAATRSKDNLNDVGAQIYLNLSLTLAVVGPLLHVASNEQELDAVNYYNDAQRQHETSPAAAAGQVVELVVPASWWPPPPRAAPPTIMPEPASSVAPCDDEPRWVREPLLQLDLPILPSALCGSTP